MPSSLDLSALAALAAHPVCAALAAMPSPPDVEVVGGTVRDRLLGREHPDVDLCVGADPEGVAAALRAKLGGSWFVLDPVFGVVRFSGGEVAVDLALRHGETWDADLRRRDLTINALGLVLCQGGRALAEPELRDPTGGLADLEARLVRTTGREALEADPVRTLRVFRFGAALGFGIDAQTRTWVVETAPLLGQVAIERCRDELCKLLAAPDSAPYLAGAADAGLLEILLPALRGARGTASIGHFDGFTHRLEAIRALDWLLSRESPLAPEDRWYLERYFGGTLSGGRTLGALARIATLVQGLAEPAGELARSLRLATAEVRFVEGAARGLTAFRELPEAPGGGALHRFFRTAGRAAPAAAALALSDHLAARDLTLAADEGILAVARRILAEGREPAITAPRPPLLRGDELIAELGIPAGPKVAELLEEIAEARADGTVRTAEEALGLVRELI